MGKSWIGEEGFVCVWLWKEEIDGINGEEEEEEGSDPIGTWSRNSGSQA